jgi:hypothetical protein
MVQQTASRFVAVVVKLLKQVLREWINEHHDEIMAFIEAETEAGIKKANQELQ